MSYIKLITGIQTLNKLACSQHSHGQKNKIKTMQNIKFNLPQAETTTIVVKARADQTAK
jgi:hypothetical protein